MDFPDLTEYIGPIVFGLIAWLSNYFGNKKKPSEEKGIVKEKKEDTFTSEFNDLYKISLEFLPRRDFSQPLRSRINLWAKD